VAPAKLKEQVLDRDKTRVIRLQAELVRDGGFFLAGGTGLGLRLGHRLSQDLDWFTLRARPRGRTGTGFLDHLPLPARVQRPPPAGGQRNKPPEGGGCNSERTRKGRGAEKRDGLAPR
jgi:hypothetical protein